MSDRTKLGLGILAASLFLGAIGDGLLRATPWGLNLFLWVAALLGAALFLAYRQGLTFTWGRHWLVLPVVFFAAAFGWRDSVVLKSLDGLALLITLSLATLRTQTVQISLA